MLYVIVVDSFKGLKSFKRFEKRKFIVVRFKEKERYLLRFC